MEDTGESERGEQIEDRWHPLTVTGTILGKKWHPVLVYWLLEQGPLGFNELKENVDGISDKVLSESLDDLQDKRLVERTVIDDKPVRVEYSLTEWGRALEPVIRSMHEWGRRYAIEASGREDPTG